MREGQVVVNVRHCNVAAEASGLCCCGGELVWLQRQTGVKDEGLVKSIDRSAEICCVKLDFTKLCGDI